MYEFSAESNTIAGSPGILELLVNRLTAAYSCTACEIVENVSPIIVVLQQKLSSVREFDGLQKVRILTNASSPEQDAFIFTFYRRWSIDNSIVRSTLIREDYSMTMDVCSSRNSFMAIRGIPRLIKVISSHDEWSPTRLPVFCSTSGAPL